MTGIPTITTPRLSMPKLGLGTYGLSGREGQRAVESALALGYRHLDTAEMYGNEEIVGAAIRASGIPRQELFVTTKVWWTNLAPDAIRAAHAASLGRLGLDYVDLYHIHWPAPGMDLAAALATLAALLAEGRTRAIGVCNFPPGLLRAALATGAPLAALQVEYHCLLDQSALLSLCRANGLVLTAYSPLGKGHLAEEPTLARIGARHGATASQVALAWLLRQEGVAAIPKAQRPESQRANLAALGVPLDAADLAAIAALPKDRRFVNPAFAPDWAA
ncbi:MAG: aldo/keto reductase [Acetobacteraceae bacterium]|nr:aldo/keto reductase [Acetobacteraceae bacterium]